MLPGFEKETYVINLIYLKQLQFSCSMTRSLRSVQVNWGLFLGSRRNSDSAKCRGAISSLESRRKNFAESFFGEAFDDFLATKLFFSNLVLFFSIKN
jgi:hypothetical protein